MASVSDLELDLYCLSDPGREPSKQVNEDSGQTANTSFGTLALVCDGMGGHAHGQAASRAAVGTIIEHLSQPTGGRTPGAALVEAIQRANHIVYEQGGGPDVEGRPGTTCVAVLIHQGGAEIAHVGDSRMYLLRGAQIYRMTRDHSVVQQMVDAGMITAEQALEHPDSNRITRALGMAPTVDVELRAGPLELAPGDLFLLASDGLTDLVSDNEILSIATNRGPEGLETTCRALVDMANLRGGHDNITVLVARVLRVPTKDIAQAPVAQTTPEAFAGPKTLVDGGASPTEVEAPATLASATLDSSPERAAPWPHGDSGAGRTVPGNIAAPGSPGNVPAAGYPHPPARTDTEPGLTQSPFHSSSDSDRGRFVSDYPGRVSQFSGKGKVVLLLAALFTLFIVGAIVLWWIVQTLSKPESVTRFDPMFREAPAESDRFT